MRNPWMLGFTVFGLALAVACGGGGESDDTGGEDATDGTEQTGPAVSPDSAATITGRVAFQGTPAAADPIDMAEEPTCAEQHTEPAMSETAIVNGNGTLKNVFVYVKEGLGERTFPAATEAVTIDQEGCQYHPHVLAIQVGQPLSIKNSDGILHNINSQPTQNQGFNISQPVEMTTERTFSTGEVMIPVKCDVHGWMEAYIGVQNHPYMAVTGDDGTFTLENLPPGTYVIEAWHEQYGTQTQNVTIGPQESQEVSFSFSSEMAGRAVPLGEPLVLHSGAHQGR